MNERRLHGIHRIATFLGIIFTIFTQIEYVYASQSNLAFAPLSIAYLTAREDTLINVPAITINSSQDLSTIYVLIRVFHGTIGILNTAAWEQTRVICTHESAFDDPSVGPNRASIVFFEATMGNANSILASLTYLPDLNYNFDWTSSCPCAQNSQTPEVISIDAFEPSAVNHLDLSSFHSTCIAPPSSTPVVKGATQFLLDVAIVAVNDPPMLLNLPSQLELQSMTCGRFSPIVSDPDVDEVTNMEAILQLTLNATEGLELQYSFLNAMNLGVRISSSSVVSESNSILSASSLHFQGTPQAMNAFLSTMRLCSRKNATLSILLDDMGGCGTEQAPPQTISYILPIFVLGTSLPLSPRTIDFPHSVTFPDSLSAHALALPFQPGTSSSIEAKYGAIGFLDDGSTEVHRIAYIQNVTIETSALDVIQTIELTVPFSKETQLITALATQNTVIDESVVQLDFTYTGITSSVIVDLVSISRDEFKAALSNELKNAGDINVVGPKVLDEFGSVLWSVTFDTLAGSTIPLLHATRLQFPLGTVQITRSTSGSQVAPRFSVDIHGVAGGTYILDLAGSCELTWPSFSTDPLPLQATALQIQTALQNHHAIDQVEVTLLSPTSYQIHFITNVYTSCPNGIRLTPRFYNGKGVEFCSTCTVGITSVDIHLIKVGSQEMQSTDTWRFLSSTISPTPWISIWASQEEVQKVVPGVEFKRQDCENPGMACSWIMKYKSSMWSVEIQPSSSGMKLLNVVSEAQPIPWSQSFLMLDQFRSFSLSITDYEFSHLLSTWCHCDMSVSKISITESKQSWSIQSDVSIPLQFIPRSPWLQFHATPISQVRVPAFEHHLLLNYSIGIDSIYKQTLICNAVGGFISMEFQGDTTELLPFSSSTAQLQTALNKLSTIGSVFVESSLSPICSTLAQPIHIWFGVPGIEEWIFESSTYPAVQALQVRTPLTNPYISIQFTFGSTVTTTTLHLQIDRTAASALSLKEQLSRMKNIGAVHVDVATSTPSQQEFIWLITFSTLHRSVPLLNILNGTNAVVTSIQEGTRQNNQVDVIARYDYIPSFGSFRFRVSNQNLVGESKLVDYSATSATVQTALESIQWLGIVSVQASHASTQTTWGITFLTNNDPALRVEILSSEWPETCVDCVAPSSPYTLTSNPQLEVIVKYTSDPDIYIANFQFWHASNVRTTWLPTTIDPSNFESTLKQFIPMAQVDCTANSTQQIVWRLMYATASVIPMWEVITSQPALQVRRITLQFPQQGYQGAPPLLSIKATQLRFTATPLATSIATTFATDSINRLQDLPEHIIRLCAKCTTIAEQQEIIIQGTSLSGSMRLTTNGINVLVPVDSTNAQALLLLNTLIPVSSVALSTIGNTFQMLVNFEARMGNVKKIELALERVQGLILSSSVNVIVNGNALGGTFSLRLNSQLHPPFRYDIDATTMQAALPNATYVTKPESMPYLTCWQITFKAPVELVISRINGIPMGLTGIGADMTVQVVQNMPSFQMEYGGKRTPPLSIFHTTAINLKSQLEETWRELFQHIVVKKRGTELYLSNISTSLQVISAFPIELTRFFNGRVHFTTKSNEVAKIAYQAIDSTASLDLISIDDGQSHNVTVFLPTVVEGSVLIQALHQELDLVPQLRMSSLFSIDYIATSTLNVSSRLDSPRNINQVDIWTTGVTMNHEKDSHLQWKKVSLRFFKQELNRKSLFMDVSTALLWQRNQILEINVTSKASTSVLITFRASQGQITGQFQLGIQLFGIQCLSVPIIFPPTSIAIQNTFKEAQSRCGSQAPPLQFITLQLPIPIASAQSTSGYFILAMNGLRTDPLPVTSTDLIVKNALVPLIGNGVTVNRIQIDPATIQFQIQVITSGQTIAVASSSWSSSGVLNVTKSEATNTAWAITIAVDCNVQACKIDFLNHVPTISVAINQLTSVLSPQISPTIQINQLQPPLSLYCGDIQLDISNMRASLTQVAQDVDVTSNNAYSWRITFSSLTPLKFRAEPTSAYALTMRSIHLGQASMKGSVRLAVDDCTPVEITLMLPLVQAASPAPSPTEIPILKPTIRYNGSTSFTVPAGESARISPWKFSHIECDQIQVTVSTTFGLLYLAFPVRYHVNYVVGSKEGGSSLTLSGSCERMKEALGELYYTAPSWFYGHEILWIDGEADVTIHVPFHLFPPEIETEVKSIQLQEDTTIALPFIQVVSRSPRNCTSTLEVNMTVVHGLLSLGAAQSTLLRYETTARIIDLGDATYRPKQNYAGADLLVIDVKQTACRDTSFTSLEIPIWIESVADPLELHWNNPIPLQLSSFDQVAMPIVSLISVDQNEEVKIQLIASANYGAVSFGDIGYNTVVCSMQEAIQYLSFIQYTPRRFGTDQIKISAVEYGSRLPPAQVTRELEVIETLQECITFTKSSLTTEEDAVFDLSFNLQLHENHTATASALHGWLSCSRCENEWLKRVASLDGLVYRPAVDFTGQDIIQFSCNHEPGVTQELELSIRAVNDPPTWPLSHPNVSVTASTPTKLCPWGQLLDRDESENYHITLTSAVGKLTLPSFIAGVFVQSNADMIELQGALDDLNALFTSCMINFEAESKFTAGTITACVWEEDDADSSTCSIANIMITPVAQNAATSLPPRFLRTMQWIGKEDQANPIEGLRFDIQDQAVDNSFMLYFQATKGSIEVYSFASCLHIIRKNAIAGDIACLQSVFDAKSVWFRPYPNVNGHDTINITYALDQIHEIPVYIEPVEDIPEWDLALHAPANSYWNIEYGNKTSLMLFSHGVVSLINGDIDQTYELAVSTFFGHLHFDFIPGMYMPIIQPRLLNVQGSILLLNMFLQSLSYIPSNYSVKDTLILELKGATSTSLHISVGDEPMYLVGAVTRLRMQTHQSIPIPLVQIHGTASKSMSLRLFCTSGSFQSERNKSFQYETWSNLSRDELNGLLSSVIYTSGNASTDHISVQLLSNSSIAPTDWDISISIKPKEKSITLTCDSFQNQFDAETVTPLGEWIHLDATSPLLEANISASNRSLLKLSWVPGLFVSTFGWSEIISLRGSPHALLTSFHKLSVRAATNSSIHVVLATQLHRSNCSTNLSVRAKNHAPKIIFQSSPWGLVIEDMDSALFNSPLVIHLASTTATFQFAQLPRQILHQSLVNSNDNSVYSSITFEANLNQANEILANLSCLDGYGGFLLHVNDQGHRQASYPSLNASAFISCPFVQAQGSLSSVNDTSIFCVQGRLCSIPPIQITSPSYRQSLNLTAIASVSYVPEIQSIKTMVDIPRNHRFHISFDAVLVSVATQITLQLTWRSFGSNIPSVATVILNANAAATRFEEILGAGPGRGVGESVQSKLEAILPLSVLVTYSQRYIWSVEVMNQASNDISTFWALDFQFMSASNGLQVDIYTAESPSFISGSFTLSLAGATTYPLRYDASAIEIQTALECLPTIDIVQVASTSATPNSFGGFVWMVTFHQAATHVFPLLKSTTYLLPQEQYILGAGNVSFGSKALVQTTRIQDGYGRPPLIYKLVLSSQHVDVSFDIVFSVASSLVSGSFQLALGNLVTTSIEWNAVAMTADESIYQSLGGRRGESLQSKLQPLIGSASILVTRSGPDSRNTYRWRTVIQNAPSNLALPTVVIATCSINCAVQIVPVQNANQIGGTFKIITDSIPTPDLAVTTTADQLKVALGSIPSLKKAANLTIRESARDLQGGVEFMIVFTSTIDISPSLRLDASSLSGLGAFGSLTIVSSVDIDWHLPPTSTMYEFHQHHTNLQLQMNGTPKKLNQAVSTLQFSSRNWFGLIQFTFKLNDDTKTFEIPVVPSTSSLSLTLKELIVYEDIPHQFIEFALHGLDVLPYTNVTIALAVTHGQLWTLSLASAQRIDITGAFARLDSLLSMVFYKSPLNYHGSEQLQVTVDGNVALIHRFQVLPVNDPPLICINNSIEGPYTTWNYPVHMVDAPQDTIVFLTNIQIDDVDASFYETRTNRSVLEFAIRSNAGQLELTRQEGLDSVKQSASSISIQGTLKRVNQALKSLSLQPPSGYTGPVSLTLWVVERIDQHYFEHIRRLTVTFQPVFALPPLLVGRQLYTAMEDIALPIYDIQVDAPPPSRLPLVDQVSYLHKSTVFQPDTHHGTMFGVDEDWRMKQIFATATNPQWFCSFQSRLYFAATSLQYGRELYASDGVSSTSLLADLNPGIRDSSPRYLTAFQGKMYFQAAGLDLSYQLVGDGCTVSRISSLSSSILFVVSQSNVWNPMRLYDCPLGYKWMSTAQATEIFKGDKNTLSMVYWNQCNWTQYTYRGITRKAFRFEDSATTGAFKHAGRDESHPIEFSQSNADFAGIVCLRVDESFLAPLPPVLWQFDGIATSKVDPSIAGRFKSPSYLTVLNSSPWLVFQATSTAFGAEIYRTNGIDTYLDDLYLGARSSAPSNFTEFQGRLVFAATSESGRELWVTSTINVNGMTWMYQVVADLAVGAMDSSPQDLVVCNLLLFFTADDGNVGREVWKWDGVSTPQLVQDLNVGIMSSNPSHLVCYNNKVYFQATANLLVGAELYMTNGVGITILKDIQVGSGSSNPSFMSVQSSHQSSAVKTALVFCIRPNSPDECTWYKSDGTTSGTIPLWESTSSFRIDPSIFQVSTFQNLMVFGVAKFEPRADVVALQQPMLKLEIDVSVGKLTLNPLPGGIILTQKQSSSQIQLQWHTNEINYALSGMTYLAPLNFHTTQRMPVVTINLTLSAQGLSLNTMATLVVASQDDEPVWIVPQSTLDPILYTSDNLSPGLKSIRPFRFTEDTRLDVPSIQLRAIDCFDYVTQEYIETCVLTVKLQVSHGILAGIGPFEPNSQIQFTENVRVINKWLEHVQYIPKQDYNGEDSIILTASLVRSSRVSIPLEIVPVNDVPFILAQEEYFEAFEDRILVLDGLQAIDVDDRNLSVVLTAQYGSISVTHKRNIQLVSESSGQIVSFSGSLEGINTALSNMTYVSSLNWNSAVADTYDTIQLKTTDSIGATSTTVLYILVIATPDPIIISTPVAADDTAIPPNLVAMSPTITIMEDTKLHVAMLGVSCVDALPSSIVTVAVFVQYGHLTVTPMQGVLITMEGSHRGHISLEGSYENVNGVLATLRYQANTHYNGADTLVISANAVDDTGGVSLPGRLSIPLLILAVNDAPVWNIAQSTVVFDLSHWREGISLSNISISDVDAGENHLELTVDCKVGLVTLGLSPELNFILGTGLHESYFVVRSTLAGLNAALRGLVFELDWTQYQGISYDSTVVKHPQIRFTVDDLGNSGSTGPNIVSGDVYLRVVTTQNQPPEWTSYVSDLPLLAYEDQPYDLAGHVFLNDSDLRESFGAMMELQINASIGRVYLPAQVGLHVVSSSATSIIVQGALEHINYALNNSYYIGAPNWFGQDTIMLLANDLGFTGTGGPQTARLLLPISVQHACDNPLWHPLHAEVAQVYEDEPLYFSDFKLVDPETKSMNLTRQLTITISAVHGGFYFASIRGVYEINATNHDSLPAYFRRNVTIQGTENDLNTALQGIVYKPAKDWNSHTQGGLEHDVLSLLLQGTYCEIDNAEMLVLHIDVLAINDPPTLSLPDYLWETELNTPLSIGPFHIDDVDSNLLEIEIAVINGYVSLSSESFWTKSGNATLGSSMTIQIATLSVPSLGISFTPASNFVGVATMQIYITDFTHKISTHLSINVKATYVLPPVMGSDPNKTIFSKLGDLILPEQPTAWPMYARPTPSVLYKSEIAQPDTDFGFWGKDIEWRHVRSSSFATKPTYFHSFRGRQLFQAFDNGAGSELWQSDGQSTIRLADLFPGPASSSPAYLVDYSIDNKVYFAADGIDLSWRPPSSHLDKCHGQRASTFHDGSVIFTISESNVWNPDKVYDCPMGYSWASTDDAMKLFRGVQGENSVLPMTYYDQCGWDGYTWGSLERKCFRFSDSKARLASYGACKHAGKSEDFRIEIDFSTSYFAGIICIRSPTWLSRGRELWSFDGSVMSRVADINPGPAGSNPAFMTEFKQQLVFQATDHNHGVELFTYDLIRGVNIAVDIEFGNRSSFPRFFTQVNSLLLFTAETSLHGSELWKFDGQFANIVSDICPGVCSSKPQSFVALPSWVFFQADDGVVGAELWKSNGIATSLVMDIYAGAKSGRPSGMTVYNNKVYFQATNGVTGVELWFTDGSTTALVADLLTGFLGSYPSFFTVASPGTRSSSVAPPLLIFYTTASELPSLWSYDGSKAQVIATPVYLDVSLLNDMPQPISIGVTGNTLFYPATEPPGWN